MSPQSDADATGREASSHAPKQFFMSIMSEGLQPTVVEMKARKSSEGRREVRVEEK